MGLIAIKHENDKVIDLLFMLDYTDLARTAALFFIIIPGHDGGFGSRADVL